MDFNVVARFGLLLVRPGMVVMVAPGLGGTHVAATVKVGLTVLVALALAPSVAVSPIGGAASLAAVIAREAAIGLCLAFVVRALVGGAELAGYLAGFQIGFSYGATIDPMSGVRNTMLATLYGMLATLGFLAINGHHEVLRALSSSYAALPIGGGAIAASLVGSVRDMLGLVFVVGLRIAAPVIVVLVLAELGVGLIARSSPALNFLVIGYPIRLVIGLLLVAALVPTVPAVTNSLVERAMVVAADAASAFR
jgi:flagellar biosynthetic protein FliR